MKMVYKEKHTTLNVVSIY